MLLYYWTMCGLVYNVTNTAKSCTLTQKERVLIMLESKIFKVTFNAHGQSLTLNIKLEYTESNLTTMYTLPGMWLNPCASNKDWAFMTTLNQASLKDELLKQLTTKCTQFTKEAANFIKNRSIVGDALETLNVGDGIVVGEGSFTIKL